MYAQFAEPGLGSGGAVGLRAASAGSGVGAAAAAKPPPRGSGAWVGSPLREQRRPGRMHQKLLKSAHYIELGSYQYWPVLVPRGIRLYTYEQIPVSLKDNPYITDGYRAYLPSRLCIKRYRLAASAGCARGERRRLLLLYTLFVWSACCFPRCSPRPLFPSCSILFILFCPLSSLRDLSFSPARVLDPWTNDGNDDEVANSSGALLFTKGSHPLFHSVFIGGTCWTRPHRQWRGHACSYVYLSFVYF